MTFNPPWRDREIRTWPRDMVLLSIGNRKGKSAGFAPGRFHLKTFQTFSHGQFHITIFVLRVGMWNRVWETHHRVLNDFKHSQIDQAYPIGQEKIQSDKAITACKSAEGGKFWKFDIIVIFICIVSLWLLNLMQTWRMGWQFIPVHEVGVSPCTHSPQLQYWLCELRSMSVILEIYKAVVGQPWSKIK